MSLRMVFNREDLMRVRIATAPDPMWELVLSLHRARERWPSPRYASWRREVSLRARSGNAVRAGEWVDPLFTLVPKVGSFPDFLTPAHLTPTQRITAFDAGCDVMAAIQRDRLEADLKQVFADRPAPRWVRDLASGDRGQLDTLVGALRRAHRLLVAPQWAELRDVVAGDHMARQHTLAERGVGALLAAVPGVRSWDGQQLEVTYPAPRTVRLAGRGLTLVPSYFCANKPVTLVDSELPPVLIYPAVDHRAATGEVDGPRLDALMTRTRARCLAALVMPRSTSDLADVLGASIGTASKQAAVLREAGLVTSTRQGSAVLHSVTELGADLLSGGRSKRDGPREKARTHRG